MKKVGIICEYNPLHNGHVYHFSKVKQESNADLIILSMSSSFTQRGDLSIIDKFSRTKLALIVGVDLVLECPSIFSMQQASDFCYYHVLNLARCGVDEIWIGSEINDPTIYEKYDSITNSSIFKNLLDEFLESGYSHKLAFSKALEALELQELKSNDLLGLFYHKAILKINPSIKLKTIQRIENNYTDTYYNDSLFQSASAIRNNLNDATKYVPEFVLPYLSNAFDENLLLPFIKYHISISQNLHNICEAAEGIENKLKEILNSNSIDEAVDILYTKRYSKSKIKRLLMNVLISSDYDILELCKKSFDFIRVLGFNKSGRELLSSIKNNIKIYTNIKNNLNPILDHEIKISKILDGIYHTQLFSNELKGPFLK